MSTETGRAALLILALLAQPARAEAPLSAIDWLSNSIKEPVASAPAKPEEPAVTSGAAVEPNISVSVIGAPSPDAAGLLPPAVTGLPPSLWGLGRTDEIVALIRQPRPGTLPALQSLLTAVLLAESEPPADAAGSGKLLLARIDALLDMGALDQVAALIDVADSNDAELFRREFDVALLTGDEDAACKKMQGSPTLAPTFPARIFCLARSGDWNAAALTLRTAEALGYVTADEEELLARFLDPDLADGAPDLPIPDRPSPLVWRMYEAVGQPLPTTQLPVAFAHAELRETAGWKAQLDAAERLARVGAVPPNQLLGLYTLRQPAASGGVWDRAAGVQKLEKAIGAQETTEVGEMLPGVWDLMVTSELEVPFATIFAAPLAALPLKGYAASLAFRIELLSPDYRKLTAGYKPVDVTEGFLLGLARGSLVGTTAPDSLARAIEPAFTKPALSPRSKALLADNRVGEAILNAIDEIAQGLSTDLKGVTTGLSLLRKVGLEDVARQTSLELMLLERRG